MALESTMLKMEEKNEQMQRKGMSSTSTTQNYCKWYHHKHYSQARVWLHVIPCRVKTEYSVNDWNWHTMPPVQGNRPLSRVTGPCQGLQAPHVAPSRLYLVLSILICWHVKVGDQETCGLTSQAMDGDHSDWCSSEKLNHRRKDHQNILNWHRKHSSETWKLGQRLTQLAPETKFRDT